MLSVLEHSPAAQAVSRGEWCLAVDLEDGVTIYPGDHGPPTAGIHSQARAFFEGTLYNRADIEAAIGGPSLVTSNEAELLLRAYEKFGASMFSRVKGVFAVVIWDPAARRVLAARDPIGVQPLFYAEAGGRYYFSLSPERAVRMPGVSSRLNDRALADWLCHRWPDPEETFFDAVKRVRPGYTLSIGRDGRRMERYWDPAPPGKPVRWIREDELEQFDGMFTQAVDRCLQARRSGIFLSGGLDSVSVAAVATDLARKHNIPAPHALSIAFPGNECNEESVQSSVASQLGLRQTMVPFADAVGPKGLLQAALDMGRTWPQPMMNAWNPAYINLASRARQQGCSVILTGSGGDDWLTVSAYHTADLLGSLNLAGLAHLLSSIKRSYDFTWRNILRATLWVYGVRPWLTIAAHAIAPKRVHDTRVRRVLATTPEWVAPGDDLRRKLEARAIATILPPNPTTGFYLREMRQSLEHPLQAIEMENAFESCRRSGVVLRHPFWEPDLVDVLFRIPPRLLNRGRRSKALVREAIAKRFPALGFQRHRKVFAYGFFTSIMHNEGPAAWKRLGGARTLASLGVVHPERVNELASRFFASGKPREMSSMWDILHLEAWAQARS